MFAARNVHELYSIVICGLPRSAIRFHIISKTAQFSEQTLQKKKVCFDFLHSFVRNTSHSKKN